MKLIKKDFRLCLHPAAIVMLGLSALVLVPNYPYSITFFYMTLGIFFICLGGRENHDIAYTMTLPVSRAQAVAARMGMACVLQITQIVLCCLFIVLKSKIAPGPNGAGMDANAALPGEGFLVFALFNGIFFPAWYKDVTKVGGPFVKGSIAVFLYIVLAVSATYAVPFVRDRLDTPGSEFLGEKLLFTGVCAALYALATFLSYRLSVKRFSALDLQL